MYGLFLGSQPRKFLKKTNKELRLRIWKKLEELKEDPFPQDVKRVISKKNKVFRVRVGSYRLQYHVFKDKKEILLFDIDKRERAFT